MGLIPGSRCTCFEPFLFFLGLYEDTMQLTKNKSYNNVRLVSLKDKIHSTVLEVTQVDIPSRDFCDVYDGIKTGILALILGTF